MTEGEDRITALRDSAQAQTRTLSETWKSVYDLPAVPPPGTQSPKAPRLQKLCFQHYGQVQAGGWNCIFERRVDAAQAVTDAGLGWAAGGGATIEPIAPPPISTPSACSNPSGAAGTTVVLPVHVYWEGVSTCGSLEPGEIGPAPPPRTFPGGGTAAITIRCEPVPLSLDYRWVVDGPIWMWSGDVASDDNCRCF